MGAPRQGPTNPGPAFRAALPKAGPARPRTVMVGEVQQEERGQVRRMLSVKERARQPAAEAELTATGVPF